MARKGILHLGLPKTGTTSIQNAVYAHRDRILSECGIHYPSIPANTYYRDVESNHTTATCTMVMDDVRDYITYSIAGITDLDEAERIRESELAQMDAAVADADWETLLISSEGLLVQVGPAGLARFAQWWRQYVDSWRVLIWIRNPVDHARSLMQEGLKHGGILAATPAEVPEPRFRECIGNAQHAFGEDSVEVFSFEEAQQSEGGIVGDFCRRIHLPAELCERVAASATRDNTSLSMEGALLLDSLNRQRPVFVDGKRSVDRDKEDDQWFTRVAGDRFQLEREVRQRVRELARDDIDWVNRTFGKSFYPDIFVDGDEQEDPASLPRDTIDSLAILISDLINAQ